MNRLNSQKGFVVPVVIAIVVVLIGGGVYLANKREVDSAKNISPTISTVDWKTYTNGKYGFEFKYPSDWQNTQEAESPIPTQKAVSFAFKTPKPNDTTIIFSVADNGSGFFEMNLPSGYAIPDMFKREYAAIASTLRIDPTISNVKVITPNGGETYRVGQEITIRWWDERDAGNSDIYLTDLKHTGTEVAIQLNGFARSSGIDGNYTKLWKISDVPSGKYKVVVYKSGTEESDRSDDYFTIIK